MASTMFATEVTGSSFLGTAMPNATAPGQARVTMGFSRIELERKPLSLIRTLARQRGVPIASKQMMINNLLEGPSVGTNYSSHYSAPKPAGGAGGGEYASMTLGELRALAKARGLRGDTKAEIISLLQSTPAPAATSSATSFGSSYSSPAPAAPAATALAGLPKATLERKSLSELRAMARIRGLRGDTKAELVKLLASDSGSAPVASSNGSYTAPAAVSYSSTTYSVSSNGASVGSVAITMRQLQTKSLSQLRAIANVKGIRGTTKDELVRQLAAIA